MHENRAAIAHVLDGAAIDCGHRVDFAVAITQLDEREAGDRVRLAVLECVKHICRGRDNLDVVNFFCRSFCRPFSVLKSEMIV